MKTLVKLFLVLVLLMTMVAPALAQDPVDQPQPSATAVGPVVDKTPEPAPAIPIIELPKELPAKATEAVAAIPGILAVLGTGLAGLLATAVIDFLKRQTPWLSKDNREALGAWVTRFIAIAVSVLSGLLVAWLTQYATYLDEQGLWAQIVQLYKPLMALIMVFGAPVVAEMMHRAKHATSPVVAASVRPKKITQ